MTMATTNDLRNPHAFPSFAACPARKSIDPSYYEVIDGNVLRPKRHWCLLAEVTQTSEFIRPRLLLRDKAGHEMWMGVYVRNDVGGEDEEWNWKKQGFKTGQCVAVLYPLRHGFLDGKVGVKLEVESYIKVGGRPLGLEM
jgi:hypothetical protein